ncbi:MAG: hypothetical protein JST31_05325, partial [Actinobacteria bacterium]|nr:hypothetical protein [Actinomycetota bacterium]
VDEEGWTELAQIHEECFLRVMELRDRVEARLQEDDVEPFRATSLIVCFEVSPRP